MFRTGPVVLQALLLASACGRTEPGPTDESAAARAGSAQPKLVRSTVAYTLREKDLIPEGIAADPGTHRLFVGSVEKRKIQVISSEGKESTFVPSGAAGLGPVIGLRVDAEHGRLWAVSEPTGRPKSDPATFRGLYAFTLSDGSLAAKIELPRSFGSVHALNDLCLDSQGTVYVTDSDPGSLYFARPGEKKLTALPLASEAKQALRFANGIACAGEQNRLYVAVAAGIAAVDPKTGTARILTAPPGVAANALGGCDGLYRQTRTTLVAIQNGHGAERVLRATLDPTGLAIQKIETLEIGQPHFDIPTTGAILDGALYFIANSQVGNYDKVGNLDRRGLKRPVILRLGL